MTEIIDDIEMTETPKDINLSPKAEGASEFRGNPEDVMNFFSNLGISTNEMVKIASIATNKKAINDSRNIDLNQSDKDRNVSAMKKILENLHGDAVHSVEMASKDKDTKKEFARIALNEMTTNNVEWKIKLNESVTDKIQYDVINTNSKKSFFKGLYLKQSAINICNLLENGSAINSPSVNKVLYYDELYRRNYDEAMMYKRYYKTNMKNGNLSKASIYEDKFESARSNAIDAKKQIKKISY